MGGRSKWEAVERSLLLPSALREDGTRRSFRDWCVDAACALVACGIAAGTLAGEYFTTARPAAGWLALDAAAGVLAPLALLFRRRWPVRVAVGLVLVSAVARTAGFPAGVAAFGVALRCRTRTAVAVAALLACASVCDVAVRQRGVGGAATVAAVVLLCTAVLLAGLFARARRDLVLALRDRALRAEADQWRRAEEARQGERVRMAREMHDALGHRITVMSLHAGALAFRPDAPAEEVARSAEILRSASHDALVELREVIGVLRGRDAGRDPGPSGPRPTLAAARDLIDEARRAGDAVVLDAFPDTLDGVPEPVRRDAYRVLQEALTNARKHAPGLPVTVRVVREDGGIRVTADNPLPGPGRSRAMPGGGFGLVGLAERAALAGGRLEHGPRPGGVFRLSAWLPFEA
ncbi:MULTISPECIES: sensor histidine kinase [Actinomadura]|uniref:histidine kinase n=1 Tax=Actinomadura yumaensis TaxID=111807 RepID=A0ABW2CBN6_9ACTN|nr:histidine kinase [Actinomadura sp. J1-007]MWK38248.1 sensor histidine kinase [Actinomadura sp. J1-007]